MNRQWLTIHLLFPLFVLGLMGIACQTSDKNAKPPEEKVIASQNEIPTEGRLVRFEKTSDKNYNLYLHMDSDTVALFKTVLVLDDNEISQLKKEGHNIRLRYNEVIVPQTHDTLKVVRYLEPVYETETK
jgi:hypothetical protein